MHIKTHTTTGLLFLLFFLGLVFPLSAQERPKLKLSFHPWFFLPMDSLYGEEKRGGEIRIFPSLYYGGFTGLQGGVGASYISKDWLVRGSLRYATGWGSRRGSFASLESFQDSFMRYHYSFVLSRGFVIGNQTASLFLKSLRRDGIQHHSLWTQLTKIDLSDDNWIRQRSWYFSYSMAYLESQSYRDHLLFPFLWEERKRNAYLQLIYERVGIKRDLQWRLKAGLIGTGPGGESNYAGINFHSGVSGMKRGWTLEVQAYGRYLTGELPLESSLLLGGSSPLDMVHHPLSRSRGLIPQNFVFREQGRLTGNFQQAGGINLRGYNAYRAEFDDFDPSWFGAHGASLSVEIGRQLFASEFFKTKGRVYAFYDLGILGTNEGNTFLGPAKFDRWRSDAGIGFLIEEEGLLINPLFRGFRFRVDFPFFLSNPPAEEDFFQFRWLIGVGKRIW